MPKSICVKIFGRQNPPTDLDVLPGTTVADVLRTLHLEGYDLQDAKNKDTFYYRPSHEIYDLVDNGAVLLAVPMLG